MREQGPTFWLLGGRADWRTGLNLGVGVGGSGIRLSAIPHGPLALTSGDGSLGGLILPRGMTFDRDGTLYLLGITQPWIKRFDAPSARFVPLSGLGGEGAEARQLDHPGNIAIAGRDLYVADTGNHRVQVFALGSLALRYVWGPWDADGRRIAVDDPDAWEPVDVTAHAGAAYILDQRYGRVYRHQPGRDALQVVVDSPAAARRWTRIVLDREGRIYLLNPTATVLDLFDAQGQDLRQAYDVGDVRDRFDAPIIRLDHKERFCLPSSLTRLCDRRMSTVPPAVSPHRLCLPVQGGLTFDREGNPVEVDPSEPLGPKSYEQEGDWISQALDSQIVRCQWHRIEFELTNLPPGTQATISTYADDPEADEQERAERDIRNLPRHLWETHYTATGPMQPPGLDAATGGSHEFLVQSRPGRYLWLKLHLVGDGYATPVVSAIRVHYPRESYVNELPAVYAADDESRWFLERFLSIFQTEWDALEQRITDMARYFDPKAVPAGEFLDYLARWLALPLEGNWTAEQRRNLLIAAPHIYARRGTIHSLHEYLQIYVQNMTGLPPTEQQAYPQLVEGFRERQHLLLTFERLAEHGRGYGAPLWSAGVVGRLQFGNYAREGDVRLVSTSDPEHDPFDEFAHRFRVFMPSAWVRTADDERMLRRALDTEKPSHVRYDLCLVEPRFRVGVQSSVGLDTIVGAYPVARLACRHTGDAPPSLAPRYRLGYDTVLTGRPAIGPGLQLTPAARVGLDTILT